MKKIKYILILFLLFLLIPINVNAISKEYKDVVSEITKTEISTEKINIYLFHSKNCRHCKEEVKFLDSIKDKYKEVANFYYFEVIDSKTNANYCKDVKKLLGINNESVPLTVVGEKHFIGYNESLGKNIENGIRYYAGIDEKEIDDNEKSFTLFNHEFKFNAKKVSIPLIAIIFGLIDGFNPCAMWVLLFLINMFIGMKNRKKMFILGFAFLFTSGFVYFLSMLGINLIFGLISTIWLQRIIAVVALGAGILNIRTYIKTRKDDGCHVIDKDKRKSIFKKTDKIIHQDKLIVALVGIILLAASVNLVELACTAIFPAMFDSVLALNNITGILRILYLVIYVLCYMIDDMIVFIIAMKTLSVTGISTKYNKYIHLISGIIMILMAILLIFKPEWIQLAF